MKKGTLTIILAVLIPTLALAQGLITFAAGSTNHKVGIDGTNPDPDPVSAALFWGPLGSLEGALIQLGATTGVNSTTGIIMNGGVRTTGAATAPGDSATFQVRAWYDGWADWETAVANGALRGVSQLFVNDTANPYASPAEPIPILDKNTWIYPIRLIPEPSTVTFTGLGAAWLLTLRRRK